MAAVLKDDVPAIRGPSGAAHAPSFAEIHDGALAGTVWVGDDNGKASRSINRENQELVVGRNIGPPNLAICAEQLARIRAIFVGKVENLVTREENVPFWRKACVQSLEVADAPYFS
jgi:hypothetical protein